MTISIITVTYNSASTIIDTLESVLSQSYPNIEFVLIDGASTDGTLKIINDYLPKFNGRAKVISEKDNGIYDALNKGIDIATGDIIGIVHSDDILASDYVIEDIATTFSNYNCDVLYGDLIYINHSKSRVVRVWKSCCYHPSLLKKGWMPPHPTVYAKKEVYQYIGNFDTQYRISSDYDFILRTFTKIPVKKILYLPQLISIMRLGGESNKSLKNIYKKMKEDLTVLRSNKIGGLSALINKNTSKISQFFKF